MRYLQVIFRVKLLYFGVFAASLWAQNPVPAPKIVPVRERKITFADAKPVLGLPAGLSRGSAFCSPEGETYVSPLGDPAGAARVMDLYGVSTTGEVKHLLRSMPQDFDSFYARDFFAAQHSLVTLLEVGHRDERDPDGPAKGREYFLAVSDYDGDGASCCRSRATFVR